MPLYHSNGYSVLFRVQTFNFEGIITSNFTLCSKAPTSSIPSIFLCKMCFLPLSKSMDFPIWLHAFQHGGTYTEVYGTICVNVVAMM